MQERHFIFDIDGTLINTEKAIIKGLQELLLEEKGSQYAPEQLYFCLGIPGSQALAQLGIDDGIPEKLKKWDAFYNSHANDVSIYPDIPEILEHLRDKGIILGTITLGLEKYFTISVTSSDTPEHKPSPGPMLYYLKKAGISPEQAVYIGDSIYDMQCAGSAGVKRALALWGCKNPEAIAADVRLAEPLDILKLV